MIDKCIRCQTEYALVYSDYCEKCFYAERSQENDAPTYAATDEHNTETSCPHCGVIRTKRTDMVQTIRNERDRMEAATKALQLFMMTDTYKLMERVPQDMLATQSRFMHGYLSVLEQRVNYYEDLI